MRQLVVRILMFSFRVLSGAIAAIVLGASVSSALAADLKIPVKVSPLASVAVYDWMGCYVGANIGGGWARQEVIDQEQGLANTSFGSDTGTGIVGGGQVGCDYQVGNWVLGVQGLFNGAGIKANHINPLNSLFTLTNKVSWLATATGRLGYTIVPSTLLYVRGGAVWIGDHTDQAGVIDDILVTMATPDKTFGGWTVGGGLECMFAPNWSVFVEYDYVGLGTNRITFTRNTDGATFPVDLKSSVHIVMAGLNFHFGGPVVATSKY